MSDDEWFSKQDIENTKVIHNADGSTIVKDPDGTVHFLEPDTLDSQVKSKVRDEVEKGKQALWDYIGSEEMMSRMERSMANMLTAFLNGRSMDGRALANNLATTFQPLVNDMMNFSGSQKSESLLGGLDIVKRNS